MTKKYKVVYTPKAAKQITKLDKSVRKLIFAWIDKNLQNCKDPRAHGKGLTANHSGQWQYRIGNYRVIADIRDDEILILVLEVGHRSEIYQ